MVYSNTESINFAPYKPRKAMIRQLIIILVAIALPTIGSAQLCAMRNKVEQGYDFWLYLPESYKASKAKAKPLPIVLFLHGRSLSGNDLTRVLNYGTLDALEAGLKLNAVVIAPQSGGGWWDPQRIMRVVDWVIANYNVDASRLYALGMSLGGYGTLDLAATYPDRIAAAMALCGGSTLKSPTALCDVPLWIMHGTADKDVPVSASRRVKNIMRKGGGTHRLRYKELVGVKHSLLARVFYLPQTYEWLMSHSTTDRRRKVNRRISITAHDIRNAYNGLKHNSVTLYSATVTSSPDKGSATDYYTVKAGDTLWRIAQMHNTSVKRLCELNGITEKSVIKVGDRLKVR